MHIFVIDLNVMKIITDYLFYVGISCAVLLNLALLIRKRFVDYPKSKKAFNILVGLITFGVIIMIFAWWSTNYDILRKSYKLEVDEDSELKEVEFHIS